MTTLAELSKSEEVRGFAVPSWYSLKISSYLAIGPTTEESLPCMDPCALINVAYYADKLVACYSSELRYLADGREQDACHYPA